MPTLQQLLEQDLGLGSEKTASENAAQDDSSNPELNKIAEELGLFEDSKPAASTEKTAAASDDEQGEEKVASLDGMYSELFPDDAFMGGEEKTAEQEKVAAEEKLGARAYDYFAERFDKRIEKIASDLMAGVGADAHISADNPHDDSRPPQTNPGNRPGDAGSAINTTPVAAGDLKAKNDAKSVGDNEQKHAPEKYASAAFRKHFLLSQLSA